MKMEEKCLFKILQILIKLVREVTLSGDSIAEENMGDKGWDDCDKDGGGAVSACLDRGRGGRACRGWDTAASRWPRRSPPPPPRAPRDQVGGRWSVGRGASTSVAAVRTPRWASGEEVLPGRSPPWEWEYMRHIFLYSCQTMFDSQSSRGCLPPQPCKWKRPCPPCRGRPFAGSTPPPLQVGVMSLYTGRNILRRKEQTSYPPISISFTTLMV